MSRLESIKIVHAIDTSPDTSCMGEYTDRMEPGIIVRQYGKYYEKLKRDEPIPERDRFCRGFKPYAGGEKQGTKEYYKYGMQDFKRMEALNNGEFYYMGIYAKAEISYSIDGGSRRLECFESGGLWGIESDCQECIEEVEIEQLDDLKKHLEQFNVNLSNYDTFAKEALEANRVLK